MPTLSRLVLACCAAGALALPRPVVTVPVAETTNAPVVEQPPTPSDLVGDPAALRPLVADYDGNGASDVLWYGPGALPDHLWLGGADRPFRGAPVTIGGTYQPLVGDFTGDGRADVFWYGAGTASDVLWVSRSGGTFAASRARVGGTYLPVVGDFTGDGRADILWYGPGSAGDVLWVSRPGGGFAARALSVGGRYRPVVGDFDGDGAADVLWYGPGAAPDALWYGGRAGFRARAATVTGTYEPVVGDFDGDRRRDVLWYAAGGQDVVWYGRARRGFAARTATMAAGTPVARDFDGDGRTDVFAYGAGAAPDAVYYGTAGRGFSATARSVLGSYSPVAGDFDGDGRGDVFWYAPGNGRDVIGFGYGRSFAYRPTTIDIGFTRAVPLRPESLRDAYQPYGYVAHAMGAIDGRSYTNALEAFEQSYARGFRVFECDHVVLADGTVLVQHPGTEERFLGLTKPFAETTWPEVEGRRILDTYTLLRAEDVVALARKYPDAYFVLDLKADRAYAFARYVTLANGDAAVMERLIPHVNDAAQLAAMRRVYPLQNYIVALYQTQTFGRLDDPELLDWVRRERVPAVMMWWADRDWSVSLAANGRLRRRYDPRLVAALARHGTTPYVHTVDAPEIVQPFVDARIGVYTNRFFPAPAAAEQRTAQAAPDAPGFAGDEG